MISIQRQLTRKLLAAVVVLLGTGLGVVYWAVRDSAQEQFDAALEAKARAISTLTFSTEGGMRVEFNDRFMHGFEDRKPRDFFQLSTASGAEIARSESLPAGVHLPRREGTLDRPARWNFTLPNGRPGRAVAFAFRPKRTGASRREASDEVQLVAASDREELDETLWQLVGVCATVGGLLVGATLWLIPRVLRRGLRPLEELGEQVTQIDSRSLATRIATEGFPAELKPIAQRVNDLLGRLDESFERERRFSADLAHELRTPLAELRSAAECALKWPESRDIDVDRETLAIAQQMERIVAHVLALARGEQGQLAVQREPVALAALIETVWAPFAGRAQERRHRIELDLLPVDGETDAALLRAILTNLFENAVDYTPVSGMIRIAVWQSMDEVGIAVANTTSEIGPEDLPKLFNRFWRKDSARTGGLHVGLGLSLARAFGEAMNWKLAASFDDEQRLVFKLTGPCCKAAEQENDHSPASLRKSSQGNRAKVFSPP